MAQEYYNLAKAAEVLGTSPGEVNSIREKGDLYGYRDGADWKFKKEDIDALLAERIKNRSQGDDDDLLLNDAAYSDADGDTAATMLGDGASLLEQAGLADLASDDLSLGGDDELTLAESADSALLSAENSDEDATVLAGEDSVFSLAEEDSVFGLKEDSVLPEQPDAESATGSGSDLNLGSDDGISLVDVAGLDDDDVVLGGSGSGSDLNLGGDSGISLIDSADDGFSLDDPVEILGGSDETLELDDDDMLSLTEDDVDTDTATELQPEDDFLLSPDMGGDADDDSESSSQVIALDSDADFGDLLGGGGDDAAVTPVLEAGDDAVDLGLDADGEVSLGLDDAAAPAPAGGGLTFEPAAPQQPAFNAAQPAAVGGAVASAPVADAPYSGLQILSLGMCIFLLCLCGMVSVDLIRNMWSWGQPFSLDSTLMDTILGMLGGV